MLTESGHVGCDIGRDGMGVKGMCIGGRDWVEGDRWKVYMWKGRG